MAEAPTEGDAARAWHLVAELLRRAQDDGAVRAHVDVVDLASLLAAVPQDEARRRTYVEVLLSGLHPDRR